MKEVIKNKVAILELAKTTICEHATLSSNFPQFFYVLFKTLPVTRIAEISFSKLKLIKSYLRSTVTRTTLDLSLIHI